MNDIRIEEIAKYLTEKLPGGYMLIVAPSEDNKTLFGMYKSNPKNRVLLELIEKLIGKLGNWSGGGSLN